MKNLSAISKKGIMVISAVIMIIAGALVALLPSTSRACSDGDIGDGTSYVHVPILNNTEETLTICRMFINTPDVTDACKQWDHHAVCSGTCKRSDDEMRVKAISFGGANYYTSTSGHSHCNRHPDDSDKEIDHTDYTFSGAKVECKIAFDVCPDVLPRGSGTSKEYTIKYYFTIDGGPEKSNTVTFNLPNLP